MKTKILLALCFLAMCAVARAAASPVTAIADASNRFCVDLYRQAHDVPGNFAFSPYSLSSALAMTYAGARGRTEEEMAHVLHLPFGQDSTHGAFASLRTTLLEMTGAPGCTLSVANRLWGQEGTPFLNPFLETTRDAYGAELERLDFVRRGEDSRRRINDWTLQQTRGKIHDLLPPGSITDLTRLVLTNAIYFKANWRSPFKGELTRDGFFWTEAGQKVRVPMMHRQGHYPYLKRDDFQALVMPYVGRQASLVILLPDSTNGLARLESNLDSQAIARWLAIARDSDVDVTLPRFRASSSFSLVDALSRMGMASAFRPFGADFSGMDSLGGSWLSDVLHKTVVDVAEQGTEAAAAAVVVRTVGVTDLVQVPPVAFTADHPFLFVIRDEGTGCILFIGRVTNPLLDAGS